MNLMRGWHPRSANFGLLPISMDCSSSRISCRTHGFSFPFSFSPDSLSSTPSPRMVCGCVKKRNPNSEPLLNPQVSLDEFIVEDFEYEDLLDDDDEFFDEYFEEDSELYVGDGSGGGGISLAGTSWDKKSLELVEEVALSFNGELGIYAFKTLKNGNIQVRVERLTNKSGSPSLMDIEAFSSRYREKLDEAELAGSIPNNIYLEVSSPGVERVIRIPQDFDRFKDRPMYVKYVSNEVAEGGSSSEHDGVLKLVSFNLETNTCIWGLADVRANRERAGKGRPLSKKQREWRLETPFTSLRLVRLYSEM
ncbi:hypothetical protein K7X08_002429 [Anisodus acutangulus]|uniref:Ribosome maturation factor RimP N-terminal domain-containing protein n=1 Tax=Anisodus acutangulus TaxID=402998 RepID=A0A9Q1LTH4_9SOLA|nr:hypothetical protein K7X08_002429 [Anisodus acutangulus]